MRAVIEDALLAQRGALIGWVPVCLGIGIGCYFSLPAEPGFLAWTGIAIAGLVGLVLARLSHVAYAPILLGLLLVMAGASLAKFRTASVEAPVLTFRYYGPIEGRGGEY